MKQKVEMVPGVKYPGFGCLNEFGEFEFIPSQVGSRKGVVKLVKEEKDFTVSTTKNLVIVHLRIPRTRGLSLLSSFLRSIDKVLLVLRSYDF